MKNPVVTHDSESGFNTRGRFLRDAALFQGKLAVDGFRDLCLMPVALIATILDAITRAEPPGRMFYEVLHFGRQTERWIDLFGAAGRAPNPDESRMPVDIPSLDDFVEQFEQKLRTERENGDVSASAKEAIDRLVRAARSAGSSEPG